MEAGSPWQRTVDAARHALVNDKDAGAVMGAMSDKSILGVVGSGAINQAKVQLDALVRTAIGQVINDVKMSTLQANSDVVEGFEWCSVLDENTTEQCESLDGCKWDLDYEPIGDSPKYPGDPPIHWSCRSTIIPQLKGDA